MCGTETQSSSGVSALSCRQSSSAFHIVIMCGTETQSSSGVFALSCRHLLWNDLLRGRKPKVLFLLGWGLWRREASVLRHEMSAFPCQRSYDSFTTPTRFLFCYPVRAPPSPLLHNKSSGSLISGRLAVEVTLTLP